MQYLYLSKLSGGDRAPAGDEHRPRVPQLGDGVAVPRDVEPVRGRRRRSSRSSSPPAETATDDATPSRARRTTAKRPSAPPATEPADAGLGGVACRRPDLPTARGEHRLRRLRAVRLLLDHRSTTSERENNLRVVTQFTVVGGDPRDRPGDAAGLRRDRPVARPHLRVDAVPHVEGHGVGLAVAAGDRVRPRRRRRGRPHQRDDHGDDRACRRSSPRSACCSSSRASR